MVKRTRQDETSRDIVCGCRVDTRSEIKEEFVSEVVCLAKEARHDAVICGKPVETRQLFKVSNMTPLIALCARHVITLTTHHFCPICGLLCATRPYVRCKPGFEMERENREKINPDLVRIDFSGTGLNSAGTGLSKIRMDPAIDPISNLIQAQTSQS